jgi:hypothetical protein
MTRRLLDQFQLPNIGYVGCSLSVYVSDANGQPTANLATLYEDLTGTGTLQNPQKFDSTGALKQPTYIDVPVVPIVTGGHVVSQTLGFIAPPGGARGNYVAAGTLYLPGDIVIDGPAGAGTFDLYAVVNLFASTTWATDVANAAKLKLILDVSALNIAPDATTSVKGKAALATAAEYLTGTDNAKIVTAADAAALWSAGSDNAGGATITLGNGGSFNLITSTTPITAFAFTTDKAGRKAIIRFNTIRTLTHNATSLILRGGQSITTAVGDLAEIESLGSGNFRVNWYTTTGGVLPAGYQSASLIANNAGDVTNDIDFGSGKVRDDTDAADLILAATNPKQLDVAFAEYSVVGTTSGGRDSTDNTTGAKTFHCYLIGGAGKNTQGFMSTSLSPTLPTGFTWKRRRGSIRWTGSAIVPFTQDANDPDIFLLTTTEQAYESANPGTAAVTVTCKIPTGLKLIPIGTIGIYNGTTTSIAGRLYGADEATTAPLGATTTPAVAPGGNFSSQAGSPANWIWTPLPRSLRSNTSAQVFFKLDASGAADRVAVENTGWLDRRA